MFGKKKVEPVVEPVAEEPKVPEVLIPSQQTIIGTGVTFVGNFESKNPIDIKGTVRGDIRSTEKLHIAAGGAYYGNGEVASIDCDGLVDGSLKCDEVASFTDTGIMRGTLSASRLVTAAGSVFEGNLTLLTKHDKATEAEAKAETEVPQA